ncbi:hypothetical protein [Burkholderia cenocepacia]|uniref:hypothetical protein n=1 Tax=Burkholderia cenocepacia TaxID=95486 RepID=UPI0016284815|nr:hypothetical protein [Burkholderia cenocepacia]ELK7720479.1 hypothetical protein [Burkholderia cenocepacia]MBR8309379.1 hypothetical protein [Burkholderia cenocepacia]MCA7963573.1 hypothetical protein [Burkholderia cenocepacia]MDR8053130.1 hypothetical protein [Burkholderia cenocepacia]MDR8063579.1 hypothetical protein [Burkholderia cenocepacia]
MHDRFDAIGEMHHAGKHTAARPHLRRFTRAMSRRSVQRTQFDATFHLVPKILTFSGQLPNFLTIEPR